VGDLVLATPALRALRNTHPKAHIAVLVKSPVADVLSGGNWMNEIIHWPAGKNRDKRRQGFLGLAGELRDKKFDWAVLFTNSFRSALLARLSGIKRRIGYDREGRGLLLTDKLLPEKADGKFVPVSMIRYYSAIARYLGSREVPGKLELFTTSEDEAAAEKTIKAANATHRPIVVLNPGASFGPAKCWLPERFAEVADRLAEQHKAAVFIACGPKEIATARAVAKAMRKPATVLDEPVIKLGALKALIRRANLLVTNDTGPRHFANAFGTPVVTIFGPTDPKWTETESATERANMVKVHCGPCMKRTCPLDHRCMKWVSTEMVLASAGELMTARTTTAAAAAK
jgi:heptosyltransferase-2